MASMFYGAPPKRFDDAKRLRKAMTECESLLWERLSKKKLDGFRFRRQHPIGNYIADFYCHKAKLIVEVDGEYHRSNEQITFDKERTSNLNLLGVKVIRFSNTQVKNELEMVMEEIKKQLSNDQ